jgi:anaerobic ribonucleoside-triphosphate reductase activating protein
MKESNTKFKIAGVISESIIDGPGLRYVVFSQGCLKRCLGCHNPQTWDLEGGREISDDELLAPLNNPLVSGITFSGGEPIIQAPAILRLIRKINDLFPNKNITIYTGYSLEELESRHDEIIDEIFSRIDYLCDGEFILALRDTSLVFRGSKNQRFWDMKRKVLLD